MASSSLEFESALDHSYELESDKTEAHDGTADAHSGSGSNTPNDLTPAERDALVLSVRGMGLRIAQKLHRTLAKSVQSIIEVDSLYGAAMLGATRAAHRYEEDTGAVFSSFAYMWMHGATCEHIKEFALQKHSERSTVAGLACRVLSAYKDNTDIALVPNEIRQSYFEYTRLDKTTRSVCLLWFLDGESRTSIEKRCGISANEVTKAISQFYRKVLGVEMVQRTQKLEHVAHQTPAGDPLENRGMVDLLMGEI